MSNRSQLEERQFLATITGALLLVSSIVFGVFQNESSYWKAQQLEVEHLALGQLAENELGPQGIRKNFSARRGKKIDWDRFTRTITGDCVLLNRYVRKENRQRMRELGMHWQVYDEYKKKGRRGTTIGAVLGYASLLLFLAIMVKATTYELIVLPVVTLAVTLLFLVLLNMSKCCADRGYAWLPIIITHSVAYLLLVKRVWPKGVARFVAFLCCALAVIALYATWNGLLGRAMY